MPTKKLSISPFQIIIHLGALLPVILLVFDYFSGTLSVNPIQDLEQRTGRTAITLLVLSLACTPLSILFNWRTALKFRRTLGLYAFGYAAIHVVIFFYLDYALDLRLILQDVGTKRYIIVGAISFILLFSLALTSFDYWKKLLKKNWKRLHKTVYLIAPLVVLHYAWAKKGDIFQIQGDIIRPLIYGAIVLLLLAIRLRPVKSAIQSVRKNFRLWIGSFQSSTS